MAAVSSPPTAEQTSPAILDTSSPIIAVPNASVDKTPNEGGRFRAFLTILKKFIGVADMAAQRFSLPAQMLEPVPNLEYWHYLDCPAAFASIPDSEDELGRMLNTLRFWFTKDLKYVKGKACKPYNSTLGEFFRCNWDVEKTFPPLHGSAPASDSDKPVRISYITEQTSHHPPVSAYQYECPEKGISAKGFDQLSAHFTGTRVVVGPGQYNHGIFITLHNHDEEMYHLNHPQAQLGGILKGSLSVSVADTCHITCEKTKLKAILVYHEDSWIGRSQHRVEGIVYKYDPEDDYATKIKDVIEEDIVARIEGDYFDKIYFSIGDTPVEKDENSILVDLGPLWPTPKIIPPLDDQLSNESRKVWKPVTEAILAKQFDSATKAKVDIEERQRQKAADRKSQNKDWAPRFFTEPVTPPGKPDLSQDGWDALKKLHNGDYKLDPNLELAA